MAGAGAVGRAAHAAMTWLLARRGRLPKPVNRLIDDVAKNPDGFAGRLAARLLGGAGKRVPPPTEVPSTAVRIYVGPTNYAGQGWHWARAVERTSADIGARNMAIELPGGFAFPADSLVPVGIHTASKKWQRAELEAVGQFTHVLFEAERPLFGPLFHRDVAREIAELQTRGASCAFMCHGTDVRSPRLHMERDPLSPYFDDPLTAVLEREAAANHQLLAAHDLPIFVSTPDLLIDVPSAQWCPVVIDIASWPVGREPLSGKTPVVVHVPSMGHVKGTHLIEQPMRAAHDRGAIEYRSTTGVPSAAMPAVIGDADIVLDQFRIGSYGVAAVEAMASGRVVIGHVLPDVRELVAERTGLALPIVEAVPETLEDVVLDLVSDRPRMLSLAADGRRFAEQVHSGERSAEVLRRFWIEVGR